MGDNPPLPPSDAPPTPSVGTRRPLPTLDILEQAKNSEEMSHSDVLRLGPDDYRILTQQRLKNAEATNLETADAVNSMRGELHGYRSELNEKLGAYRDEFRAEVRPLKAKLAGLAGLALVGSAVGSALITYLITAIVHAIR